MPAFSLRPYQQQAVAATLQHFRQSDAAAVIVLPTGAGKSLVIAELARLARRRILVLAHVQELVEQNHSKYASYGLDASIFAAGLQRRESHTQVIFGSVQSVARNPEAFAGEFSLLIIDECHRVTLEETSQYQQIIRHLRQGNARLKVLGLTATPYRLDSGWIYQYHRPRQQVCSDQPKPFRDCIFELPLRAMIADGFLSPVQQLDAPVAFYDFEQLRPSASGHYSEADLNQVVLGKRRATARIIEQIVALASSRQGVMIFAATTAHAREILGYLPPACSALILGDMRPAARASVIAGFKSRQIRFLVNVAVLTTGFDAPHVDMIAILRPTQSIGLYQQIVGRGLRLSPGKTDCLVADYAGNVVDLYRPQIDDPRPHSDTDIVTVVCPLCQHANLFWGKTDADGHITEHYGRRCRGLIECESGPQQCDYRFRFKECPQCGAENDIAARQCHQCQHLLVDPDDKLRAALQLRDALVLRCAGMSLQTIVGRDGNPRLQITYHDEDGAEVSESFGLHTPAQRRAFYQAFSRHHLRDRQLHFNPTSPDAVIAARAQLRAPDFVIARQVKQRWQITDKLFDYEGRYRRANALN